MPSFACSYFADNRANWDDRARAHEASGYYGIDSLAADPQAITPELAHDLPLLGDVAGKDVVHLQCHLGLDTVSLARLGASRVVGLDFSHESLEGARRLAECCGLADRIELVEANVYDARSAIEGSFDLVYTSLGVLCWLPDVASWGRVVASLLNPGGRFVMRDDHPMFMALAEDVSGGFTLGQPYFEQAEPLTWEDEGSYIDISASGHRVHHTVNHQWNHALSEILMALINAGLVIDHVEETTTSAWCIWPDLLEPCPEGWRLRDRPERLPLQYAIAAHKPGV